MSFAGGIPHVRVVDVDGSNDRQLVQSQSMSFSPRFSPDGRSIAFSMAVDGNTDIYVVDADGGLPRRLTTTPGIDTSPSFSPDGSRIVFESDRGGAQQIYVMDADGSGQRRISFGGGANSAPVWSPDGERIAFARWTGVGHRHRRDEPDRSQREDAHQRLAGRGPELGPGQRMAGLPAHAAGNGGNFALHRYGRRRRAEAAGDANPGADPNWSGAAQ